MESASTAQFICPWPMADVPPALGIGEVHVWCVGIAVEEQASRELLAVLSADERERAARYLFDRHRWRFIAGRAAQRLIISHYVNVAPDKLEFIYTALGKPALAECLNEIDVKFNVSNSGDMALLAVTRGVELGIDVEHIRDNIDHVGLAARFFAAEERDKLQGLPDELRLVGFFDCWTRKEAFLKAIGKGLTFPLDRAVVSIGKSEPCRLLSLDGSEAAAAAWSLFALSPADRYVAAIAIEGAEPNIKTLGWKWRV